MNKPKNILIYSKTGGRSPESLNQLSETVVRDSWIKGCNPSSGRGDLTALALLPGGIQRPLFPSLPTPFGSNTP